MTVRLHNIVDTQRKYRSHPCDLRIRLRGEGIVPLPGRRTYEKKKQKISHPKTERRVQARMAFRRVHLAVCPYRRTRYTTTTRTVEHDNFEACRSYSDLELPNTGQPKHRQMPNALRITEGVSADKHALPTNDCAAQVCFHVTAASFPPIRESRHYCRTHSNTQTLNVVGPEVHPLTHDVETNMDYHLSLPVEHTAKRRTRSRRFRCCSSHQVLPPNSGVIHHIACLLTSAGCFGNNVLGRMRHAFSPSCSRPTTLTLFSTTTCVCDIVTTTDNHVNTFYAPRTHGHRWRRVLLHASRLRNATTNQHFVIWCSRSHQMGFGKERLGPRDERHRYLGSGSLRSTWPVRVSTQKNKSGC